MKRQFRKINFIFVLGAAALLSACAATPIQPTISGYTCCNLRPYKDWISSTNVQGGTVIPAGEPAKFDSIKGNYYVYGTIGGRDAGLINESSKGKNSKEDTLRWARRIVVAENPRTQLASWPSDVQTAVRYGKVFVGMTKEQVLMSLGYPSVTDTPDIKAATWRYWTTQDDAPVDLLFGEDNKLASVKGKAAGIQTIVDQH